MWHNSLPSCRLLTKRPEQISSLFLLMPWLLLLVALVAADAVSLQCAGGLPEAGLPEAFFEQYEEWHTAYMRDSLARSREFLHAIYETKLLPNLQENLDRCPLPVLQIMMDSVLASSVDYSMKDAQGLYELAMRLVTEHIPLETASILRKEWEHDTVYTYPLLFGMDYKDCHGSHLKVYVYEVPAELTEKQLDCALGQWGTEVLFHRYFQSSTCRTLDAEEADFFLVPVYSTCLFTKDELENDNAAADRIWNPLLKYLFAQPWFHRRKQLDHIFIFADGQSARVWDSYDLVRSEAIFMMVESKCPTWDEPMRRYSDIKSCSSSWKDILIPGHTDHARLHAMRAKNRPTEQRDLLMTFHGSHSGNKEVYQSCAVRDQILQLADLDGVDVGGFIPDYFDVKGRSHFCLIPAGTSPWTNQLYESIHCGCIPVILSDEYEVAFQHVIEWHRFSIKLPESMVGPELHNFLQAIPLEVITEMKAEVDAHSCWFDYFSEDRREVERLNKELGGVREKLDRTQAQISGERSAVQQIDELDSQLRFSSAEVTRLQTELEAVKKQETELRRGKYKYEVEMAKVTQENQKMQEELVRLRFQTQHQEGIPSSVVLAEELDKAEKDLEAKDTLIRELQLAGTRAGAQLVDLMEKQRQSEVLLRQVPELEAESHSLRQELNGKVAEISALKATLAQTEETLRLRGSGPELTAAELLATEAERLEEELAFAHEQLANWQVEFKKREDLLRGIPLVFADFLDQIKLPDPALSSSNLRPEDAPRLVIAALQRLQATMTQREEEMKMAQEKIAELSHKGTEQGQMSGSFIAKMAMLMYVLEVSILSGSGLRDAKWKPSSTGVGLSCTVEVSGKQEKLETKSIHTAKNPVWNHTGELQMSHSDSLRFAVHGDKKLGQAVLPASRAVVAGFEGELPLEGEPGLDNPMIKAGCAIYESISYFILYVVAYHITS
eukprot:symbB.v1.2.005594.t1/scaffold326.1/size228935/16